MLDGSSSYCEGHSHSPPLPKINSYKYIKVGDNAIEMCEGAQVISLLSVATAAAVMDPQNSLLVFVLAVAVVAHVLHCRCRHRPPARHGGPGHRGHRLGHR